MFGLSIPMIGSEDFDTVEFKGVQLDETDLKVATVVVASVAAIAAAFALIN